MKEFEIFGEGGRYNNDGVLGVVFFEVGLVLIWVINFDKIIDGVVVVFLWVYNGKFFYVKTVLFFN